MILLSNILLIICFLRKGTCLRSKKLVQFFTAVVPETFKFFLTK